MAYSNDMRRLAMQYVHIDGRSLEDTCQHLRITITTLKNWLRLNKAGTLYEVKPPG